MRVGIVPSDRGLLLSAKWVFVSDIVAFYILRNGEQC